MKESPPAANETVEVYVPCGVSAPFQAIKAAFEEGHPGVSVRMLVEGNVDLVKRLEKGERPDVFVNIGDREMDLLAERGAVVSESQVVYATTSLVLVTPRTNPHEIQTLADLARPEVKKIALAEPDRVSSGYHARQLLQEAGLWDSLQPQLVTKTGARGPLNLLLKGQADAAFIYSTCLYEDRTQPPSGPADANPKLHVIALKGDVARVPCVAALPRKNRFRRGDGTS
jgi:molybdate transport system substrate-binding protein